MVPASGEWGSRTFKPAAAGELALWLSIVSQGLVTPPRLWLPTRTAPLHNPFPTPWQGARQYVLTRGHREARSSGQGHSGIGSCGPFCPALWLGGLLSPLSHPPATATPCSSVDQGTKAFLDLEPSPVAWVPSLQGPWVTPSRTYRAQRQKEARPTQAPGVHQGGSALNGSHSSGGQALTQALESKKFSIQEVSPAPGSGREKGTSSHRTWDSSKSNPQREPNK